MAWGIEKAYNLLALLAIWGRRVGQLGSIIYSIWDQVFQAASSSGSSC